MEVKVDRLLLIRLVIGSLLALVTSPVRAQEQRPVPTYNKDVMPELTAKEKAEWRQSELDVALMKAAHKGDLVRIKSLLRQGANINTIYGESYQDSRDLITPLRVAASAAQLEAVRLLLGQCGCFWLKVRKLITGDIIPISGLGRAALPW